MTLFDWFLIAILAYSTIRAFMRGIILELFSLAGLIAGILLAAWNYPQVALQLGKLITAPAVAQIVAFLLIVVGVMLLAAILGKLLHRTASAVGLGFFDRLLGAGFGFLRGCLFGVAIMMAVAAFLPDSAQVSKSQTAPYFLTGAHAVSFVVPHDLQQQILNGAARLKHNAPDWIKLHR
jgi:membrane protein required for colicin V production